MRKGLGKATEQIRYSLLDNWDGVVETREKLRDDPDPLAGRGCGKTNLVRRNDFVLYQNVFHYLENLMQLQGVGHSKM